MHNKHILSVIIATFNAASDLQRTLNSFSSIAESVHIEIIIQDGASTDSTCAVAESFSQRLSISIESKKDAGIYDAWNKALERISGEWVLFMGAGDVFCHEYSLAEVAKILRTLPENYDYYSLPVIMVQEDGTVIETVAPAANAEASLAQGMCIPHQGLFHRCRLFVTRRFDIHFRIAGDYAFVAATLHAANCRFGTSPCVKMLVGGVSSTMPNMLVREKEFLAISRRYFSSAFPWKIYCRIMRSVLYTGIKKFVGKKTADIFADIPRILLGKEKLWSRKELQRVYPSLPARPSVDLLVATVGRKDELRRLLQSLDLQSYTNFHIFLADQNCEGYLDDMLEEFSRLPITRIMLPSEGVSKARNALLPLSSADVIVFPDDDCWYAPDTIEQVVHAFQKQGTASALLGVWRSSENAPQARYGKNGGVSPYGCFRHAGTCVQFYRREAVLEAKQFDEILGPGTGLPYGCGEDTDFLLRASAKGMVLRDDSINVFHPDVDPSKIPDKKIADYAAGRMYLLRKHKFSYVFQLCNVLFSLVHILKALLLGDRYSVRYRWAMFCGRIKGLIK